MLSPSRSCEAAQALHTRCIGARPVDPVKHRDLPEHLQAGSGVRLQKDCSMHTEHTALLLRCCSLRPHDDNNYSHVCFWHDRRLLSWDQNSLTTCGTSNPRQHCRTISLV